LLAQPIHVCASLLLLGNQECHTAMSENNQSKVSLAAPTFIAQRLSCVTDWTTE